MSDIQLVFAVRKAGDEIRLYSCRYFGATNFQCARWKFQRTNMSLEKLGKVEVMPYQYAKGPGAPAQLAAHLGEDWATLQNMETFNTVLRGMQSEKTEQQ